MLLAAGGHRQGSVGLGEGEAGTLSVYVCVCVWVLGRGGEGGSKNAEELLDQNRRTP